MDGGVFGLDLAFRPPPGSSDFYAWEFARYPIFSASPCLGSIDPTTIESHVVGVVPTPPALALLGLGALLALIWRTRRCDA
jgi:hypothetical protein